MLLLLKLQGLVRGSQQDLRDVMDAAAELLGLDPEPIKDPAQFEIPNTRTLQRSMVKLDMTMMLWQRHQWHHGLRMATCFLADASQQGREDYFCQRMDGFVKP